MQASNNPFEKLTGSDQLRSPVMLAFLTGLLVISAYLTAKIGLIGGMVFLLIPFVFTYLLLLFRIPVIGLYSAIVLGFVLLGIGRYVKGIPIGLAMDGILILTYIALFFNKFQDKIDWQPARKDITILAAVWFVYSILQILNPEARSFEAWFSGRGVGLYMFLLVPLTLLFIDTERKLNLVFYFWAVLSVLVTMKGVMQIQLGVDPWEKAWLDEGNYKTHILFGKLRVFSFLSDAGQFGANQAYSGVVAAIVSAAMKDWRKKLFFVAVALFAFYGMIISGTRGAISIPATGFFLFFILRKNKMVMISGFVLMIVVFSFFKFTTIGQGNYQIRRMRTAFDPNDASFQVRLENQRKLKTYMASRPFGGGIGHGGVKAQRYLPNAYLSQVPTDSGYVLVWVEMGVVGLLLFLFILFYVIITSSFRIMFRIRDPMLKLKMSALACGIFGIMVANYGNAVLAQMPTSMLIYISIGLLMNMKSFDSKASESPQQNTYIKNI
jgi:cell division protein FtsW (lipid II flippase)